MKLYEEILFSRILVFPDDSCGYEQLGPWTHEVFVQYTDEGSVAHVFGMAKNSLLEDIDELKISDIRKIIRKITKPTTTSIKWKRPGGKKVNKRIV